MHIGEGWYRLVLETSPDGLNPWDRQAVAHGDDAWKIGEDLAARPDLHPGCTHEPGQIRDLGDARTLCSDILGHVQAAQQDENLYGMVAQLSLMLDGDLGDEAERASPDTEAVNVLFRNRHHLAPDALRSLQSIYLCASAARYREPHEAGWLEDAEFYATHDVSQCEADDQPGELDDDAPNPWDPSYELGYTDGLNAGRRERGPF